MSEQETQNASNESSEKEASIINKVQQTANDFIQGFTKAFRQNDVPEEIDIPVEGLGHGLYSTASECMGSINTVGRYTFLGLKHGVLDIVGLSGKAVNYTKEKFTKTPATNDVDIDIKEKESTEEE